jgi:DNA-binding PucR family transcriptional regulator
MRRTDRICQQVDAYRREQPVTRDDLNTSRRQNLEFGFRSLVDMNNVLGPLLNTAAEERDLLLETLETYFTAGSIAEAAKRLFCHRNTVRHRLSRIEDLTGRSVDNPSGAVELYIAIQTMLRLPNPPD